MGRFGGCCKWARPESESHLKSQCQLQWWSLEGPPTSQMTTGCAQPLLPRPTCQKARMSQRAPSPHSPAWSDSVSLYKQAARGSHSCLLMTRRSPNPTELGGMTVRSSGQHPSLWPVVIHFPAVFSGENNEGSKHCHQGGSVGILSSDPAADLIGQPPLPWLRSQPSSLPGAL